MYRGVQLNIGFFVAGGSCRPVFVDVCVLRSRPTETEIPMESTEGFSVPGVSDSKSQGTKQYFESDGKPNLPQQLNPQSSSAICLSNDEIHKEMHQCTSYCTGNSSCSTTVPSTSSSAVNDISITQDHAMPARSAMRNYTKSSSHEGALISELISGDNVKKGHTRAASHGKIMDKRSLGRNQRTVSKSEFILQSERNVERNVLSDAHDSAHNNIPSRLVSRSESTYTARTTRSTKSSITSKLCFWRKPPLDNTQIRIVVPNHKVPLHTPADQHPNGIYPNNYIRTTKYTLISFLPKNLFEQFHRFANLYFISILLLNWILDVFGKEIAMLPVVFVLAVTCIKDLFEDRRRYNSDKRVNNSLCLVWKGDEKLFKQLKWQKIRVGDLVRLKCNDKIPADILVLHTSDQENGLCYMETTNLDGESNLKKREVVRGFTNTNSQELDCKVEVKAPTTKIDQFEGTVICNGQTRVPVTVENLLLRDCILKNTEFVEGIVVYAGRETKTMLNNKGCRHKRTELEIMMNSQVLYCVLILAALCFVGATGSGLWLHYFPELPFDIPSKPSESSAYSFWESCITFLIFVIILQMMIPLSLYVTIEFTKLFQIFHIQNDINLYDPETNKKIECRATNIPEDLGQIQYVFSDKTGTLTENKMIFRRCTIGGEDYDQSQTNSTEQMDNDRSTSEPAVIVNNSLNLLLEQLGKRLSQETVLTTQEQRIVDFFTIMAVCNTVVIAKRPQSDKMKTSEHLAENIISVLQSGLSPNPSLFDSDPTFEAESPDELALVQAASAHNCKLMKRTPTLARISISNEYFMEYEILHTLPFDSTRKRMSIVLKNPKTGELILFCKGADSAIFSRLKPTENGVAQEIRNQTMTQLNNYAREGLRTLVLAKRVLTEQEYYSWLVEHNHALNDLHNREKRVVEAYSKLENNLEIVGATGIEDRLQEGVPETIESLRKAGIVVWVLTGDKQETAINIAYSCKLFSSAMEILKVNARSKGQAEQTIMSYLEQAVLENSISKQRALVVDGKSLTYILDPKTNLLTKFLALTKICSAVLCCRSTPLQKGRIVIAVKDHLHVRTLAIGDGANDVSMIQRADVGIGISGKEGMQAVMASDFAISKFKYLERLLLVHGHWCFDRLSRMILYFFYKNAAWVFVIFWYQLLNGWSGSVMIDQMYLMVFNLFFTALPPMAIGIYDQDAPARILLAYPELYKQEAQQNHLFWLNILDAFYQSVVIFFVSYCAYSGSDVGMFEFGTVVTSACMYTMLVHMAIEAKSWVITTIIHVLSIAVSIVFFYAFAFVYNSVCINCLGLENPFWVIHELIGSPVHWAVIVLTTILAVFPRLVMRCMEASLFPSTVTKTLLKIRQANRQDEELCVPRSRFTSVSTVLKERMSCLCFRKQNHGVPEAINRVVPPVSTVTTFERHL